MKTRFLLLFFCLFSASAFAAVISVVNGDNLQTKINDATAGDVLVVGPGNYVTSGEIVINKKLTLLGPGYFKTGGTAFLYQVKLEPGSSGTYLSGFEIQFDAFIADNNITLIRNLINRTAYVGYGNAGTVNISNTKILQNYFNGNISTSIQIGNSSNLLTNYQISNNILKTNVEFRHSNSSSGIITNNIFDVDSTNHDSSGGSDWIQINGGGITNISFYNNIFKGGFLYSNHSSQYTIFSTVNTLNQPLNFKYNIYDILPSGYTIPANNLLTTAKIFAGYPTNTNGLNNADGRAILAPGSPAAGFGRKAPYGTSDPVTDAGAFGGDQPYVLSGIPVGPYIYSMSVPPLAAANSVIPVTVKAKTNN